MRGYYEVDGTSVKECGICADVYHWACVHCDNTVCIECSGNKIVDNSN